MPVSFTNELYGEEDVKRRARVDARFVNNAMMATLAGGGDFRRPRERTGRQRRRRPIQFRGAGVRAGRRALGPHARGDAAGQIRQRQSNIRWSYGHETIPRHLRDVIVTEYGVADIRGKSDAEVIAAMLGVADSRFQDELMRQAKDAGKLPKNFEIPAAQRDNHPERIARALKPAREAGLLPSFPFGSDFTDDRAAADSGAAIAAGSPAGAAAAAGLLWQGLTPPAGCGRPANAWHGLGSTSPRRCPNAPTAHWSARRWRGARASVSKIPSRASFAGARRSASPE